MKENCIQNEQQLLTLRNLGKNMIQKRTMFLAFLMVSFSLSGCFGEPETEAESSLPSVWDFEKPERTWYHFPNAVDAWGNDSVDLAGRNVPMLAEGTYYSIGISTFEPTMGCLLYTSPSPRDS